MDDWTPVKYEGYGLMARVRTVPLEDEEVGMVEYDGCPHCIEELHDKGAKCRRGCRCSCHRKES